MTPNPRLTMNEWDRTTIGSRADELCVRERRRCERCLPYVEIGEFVFAVQPRGDVAPGSVGLNTVQRKICE